MIQLTFRPKQMGRTLTYVACLVCYQQAPAAEDRSSADTQPSDSKLHVTHILGFEGISKNANGSIFLQDGYLRFQRSERFSAQIPLASIQDLVGGEQDRQVGGAPMTLAKMAVPYGGGRVISLFSHKKFDTVTLEYLDTNGGFHGAIFRLNKGAGQLLGKELESAGVHITPEATNESK